MADWRDDMPPAEDGRRLWDEGRADARANRRRRHEPAPGLTFAQRCRLMAYLGGYNAGMQELLQERYGDAPEPAPAPN